MNYNVNEIEPEKTIDYKGEVVFQPFIKIKGKRLSYSNKDDLLNLLLSHQVSKVDISVVLDSIFPEDKLGVFQNHTTEIGRNFLAHLWGHDLVYKARYINLLGVGYNNTVAPSDSDTGLVSPYTSDPPLVGGNPYFVINRIIYPATPAGRSIAEIEILGSFFRETVYFKELGLFIVHETAPTVPLVIGGVTQLFSRVIIPDPGIPIYPLSVANIEQGFLCRWSYSF